MTHKEIISQVQRRLGHRAFDGQLKADYQYAVNWAEQELMVDAKPAKKTVTFQIKSTQAEYSFVENLNILDFSEPFEIQVYDSDGNHILVEEVTYDKWLRWNPNEYASDVANDVVGNNSGSIDYVQTAAELTNKLLVSVHYMAGDSADESGFYISFKPAINGTVVFMYSVSPLEDIWTNLEESPRMPEQFHHFIIPGAVYYLAQIEVAQAKDKGDTTAFEFFSRLQGTSFAEFERRKNKVREKSDVMTKAVRARPDMWYDDPRKYR